MANEIIPAVEFQKIPLDVIIGAPLGAAINAQQRAADTTFKFINSLLQKPQDGAAPGLKTIDLQYSYEDTTPGAAGAAPTTTTKHVVVSVPLLAITPIPHLRIDSVTTHFKYEITQIESDKNQLEWGVAGEASSGPALAPFASITFKGNVSSSNVHQSSTNRSGLLEITVNASEAPIPEGLARLLSLLAKAVEPK